MYIKKSRIVIAVIAVAVISSILTTFILNPFGGENLDKFLKFISTTKIINGLYYEDIDRGEAAEAAIAGVASSTGDPYTMYLWGDEAKAYIEDLKGDYCGVGLYIEKDFELNLISVVSSIAGSVAEEAGIKTGDKILAIDGIYFTGDELNEAASTMRGEEGTVVKVLVRDGDSGVERELTLRRSRIVLDSVSGQMLDSNVGYIGITQFTEGVSEEFVKELDALSKKDMKSLIIDLRNNPGGLLEEVVSIISCFVEPGKIITYTEDKAGNKTEYFSDTVLVTKTYEMPIVLLINEGSASASEVMTGAMKDYGLAKVIGEKSYGKGIVQSVINISEDILSLTTARYFSPNGVCIHGDGIEPDIVIEMDDNTTVAGNVNLANDVQLLAALDFIRE